MIVALIITAAVVGGIGLAGIVSLIDDCLAKSRAGRGPSYSTEQRATTPRPGADTPRVTVYARSCHKVDA